MLCEQPYTGSVVPVGCGKCMSCRINKRRVWTHRLMLETIVSDTALFVTLTYNDLHLPSNLSLDPLHSKLWMKRFRRTTTKRIRFYLVGEYGTKGTRGINPHYHVALFNASYDDVENINKTWKKGNIHVGDLTPASASYLCGYVTKKMTQPGDHRLKGRHPEFSRQSNRPGIGAKAMEIVGEVLFSKHAIAEMEKTGDVPRTLLHGKRSYPLGPYLRQQLRNYIGMPDEYKALATYNYSLEVQALRKNALSDPVSKAFSLSEILAREAAPKILQLKTRQLIHETEKTL